MNRIISKRFISVLLMLFLATVVPKTVFAAESDTGTLRLNTPDASGNTAFAVENMFPGDAETKEFTVKVNHKKPITLYYHADIRPGYEKLAEVMKIKVYLPQEDVMLYDGLMRDMPNSLEHNLNANKKELIYRITVYLDTDVGNDYQFKSLIADFRWWYTKETDESVTITPASVKIAAEKIMDGQYPRGNTFSFVLSDENKEHVQTVKNKDGVIEFDTLSFNKEGKYIYYLTELAGDDNSIQYDETIYEIAVTVTKQSNAYTADVSYKKDGETYNVLPRFINTTKSDNLTEATGDGSDNATAHPSWTSKPDNVKTSDDTIFLVYIPIVVITGFMSLILFLIIVRKRNREDRA